MKPRAERLAAMKANAAQPITRRRVMITVAGSALFAAADNGMYAALGWDGQGFVETFIFTTGLWVGLIYVNHWIYSSASTPDPPELTDAETQLAADTDPVAIDLDAPPTSDEPPAL